jgi:hypothetical protein
MEGNSHSYIEYTLSFSQFSWHCVQLLALLAGLVTGSGCLSTAPVRASSSVLSTEMSERQPEPEPEPEPEPAEPEPVPELEVMLVCCPSANKKLLAFLLRGEAEEAWSDTSWDVLRNADHIDGTIVKFVCKPDLTVGEARAQLAAALPVDVRGMADPLAQIPQRFGGEEVANDE